MVVASGWVLTRLEMHLILTNTEPPPPKKTLPTQGAMLSVSVGRPAFGFIDTVVFVQVVSRSCDQTVID